MKPKRTCKIVKRDYYARIEKDNDGLNPGFGAIGWYGLSCGHELFMFQLGLYDEPNYCPICGKEIIKGE